MILKRVIALSLLLMTTMAVCAQTEDSVEVNKKKWTSDGYYSVVIPRKREEQNNDSHFYKAGNYLQKSASLEELAWGFSIASGVLLSGVITEDRKIANTTGFIAGGAAIVCHILSIHYKWKSGEELKLVPNGIAVTF